MAKRTKKGASSIVTTAEGLGAALGHVAARLDAWKKQRAEIAADIQRLLQQAQTMLGDLGAVAAEAAERSRSKGGRPKGYKMSEETKRKLRAAWKRRKAAKDDKANA